ncbi:MAG: hypothetical protein LBU37_01245 [Tannerellaceae bacterium]|nr:hypothetical protein [Tannerellaceae bacterium]
MTTHRKINALRLFFALPFTAGLQAQVSVGSLLPTEPAAFLQIKEYDATTPGDATADKGGLLLPRIEIKNITDVTVVQGATKEQKEALTGLLVYNVSAAGGIEEGVCEWNGSEWILLETESKTAGSKTKKAVVRSVAASLTEDNVPSVQIGVFEFRIKPPNSSSKKWEDMLPQMRIAQRPHPKIDVWYHIARFWDYNDPGDAAQSSVALQNINKDNPYVGYTYEAGNKTLGESAALGYNWVDLHDKTLKKEDMRYEVWLANLDQDHVYNVHFIYAVYSLGTPFYAVIATEY